LPNQVNNVEACWTFRYYFECSSNGKVKVDTPKD